MKALWPFFTDLQLNSLIPSYWKWWNQLPQEGPMDAPTAYNSYMADMMESTFETLSLHFHGGTGNTD
jgi:hypothetical protein